MKDSDRQPTQHSRANGKQNLRTILNKVSALDFILGVRMLTKYPGLTFVGGLGMSVAIAIGALFASATAIVDAELPFDDGDRVVALENWDTKANNQERRIQFEFFNWQKNLTAIEDLTAFRSIQRNLIVPGASARPVIVAEMTSGGFRVARVPPIMGRTLRPEDEFESATPVMVISHKLWRHRFDSDLSVLDRTVKLGDKQYTIVGIMPEGFGFPLFHEAWIPLRLAPLATPSRQGPSLFLFGRLAANTSLKEAQSALSTLGSRAALDFPQSSQHLKPRLVSYTRQMFDDMEGWEIPMGQFLVLMLLGVVCANVAVLVYARTASRNIEIAVRSALGASRGRIVLQYFAEALVTTALAAGVGLTVASLALDQADAVLRPLGKIPFWIQFDLSLKSIAHVTGLALIAAVIIGVIPALKSTGGNQQVALGRITGGTELRMGKTWTALIVLQFAFAVAVLPITVALAEKLTRHGLAEPGFAAGDYVTSTLYLDQDSTTQVNPSTLSSEFRTLYGARQTELLRGLQEDRSVSAATLASALPGEEPTVRIELDTPSTAPSSQSRLPVRTSYVNLDFFAAFEIPLIGGRHLESGDLEPTSSAILVNRSFAETMLNNDAVGRRIRYVEGYRSGGRMQIPDGLQLNRWYEIVGIVADFPPDAMDSGSLRATVYHPAASGDVYPMKLAVRTNREQFNTVSERLREIATAVDPTLRLGEIQSLDSILKQSQSGQRLGGLALGLIALFVLLIATAGIYALMSFTVSQRTREIGIRCALGAHPYRVLGTIVWRAIRQLGGGALIGVVIGSVLLVGSGIIQHGHAALVLVGVTLLMGGAGLLATLVPARRGVLLQPMSAIRED